jgi:hypothetical protein
MDVDFREQGHSSLFKCDEQIDLLSTTRMMVENLGVMGSLQALCPCNLGSEMTSGR